MGTTLWHYYELLAAKIADRALSGIDTLCEWQNRREDIYRQFMRSMGLDPLPQRCDLDLTEFGEFSGRGYRAKKLGYRILPDCWATGNLYLPDPLPAGKLPTVLYLCGHSDIGVTLFQLHAMMWARRGYACFVLDTIEQHDNPGTHRGLLAGRYDWISLGYSGASGELWNTIRAVDMLETLPEVDAGRIGATGISGGGTLSFAIAVADERIRSYASVCGVSGGKAWIDLRIARHGCECGSPYNIYQKDNGEFAALVAPRPGLLCFARDDGLFSRDEYISLADRGRSIYRLYGCEDDCRLFEYPGPHAYQSETIETINKWFDRHVAGENHPAVDEAEVKRVIGEDVPSAGDDNEVLAERVVTILNGQPPSPHRLEILPELLSPVGAIALPQGPDDWPKIRESVKQALRRDVFCSIEKTDEKLQIECVGEWLSGESASRFRKYRGQIGGMDIWIESKGPIKPTGKVIVAVADRSEGAADAGGRVGERAGGHMVVRVEPRGCGLTAFDPSQERYFMRAGAATGITPALLMIHDLHHVMKFVYELPYVKGQQVYLYGRGDAGVACLYHAIFDDGIAGVIGEGLPLSHRQGAYIPGILRVLDIDHALGLIAPRPVAVANSPTKHSSWSQRLYARLNCPERRIIRGSLTKAVNDILTIID